MTDLFQSRTRAEWEALRAGIKACLEPMPEPDEAIERLSTTAPAFATGLPVLPFTVNRERLFAAGLSPRHGEHTREILQRPGYKGPCSGDGSLPLLKLA